MISKFTNLCNLVLENVERTLKENFDEPLYAVPAEVDRETLTGIAKLIADFTDVKPATIDEIIEAIKNNVEGASDEDAVNAIQELVDGDVIKPVEASAEPDVGDREPSESELSAEEPVVADPNAVVPSAEEEEDEAEASTPLVNSTPEVSTEDGLEDEEDTFSSSGVGGGDDSEEDMLDDDDDTPTGELLKRERMGQDKKEQARNKALSYILQKRGKSPEEIQQFLNKMKVA